MMVLLPQVKQNIVIADKASKSDIFHHDGSTNMSGSLNMGGNEIVNLKPFVEDDDCKDCD